MMMTMIVVMMMMMMMMTMMMITSLIIYTMPSQKGSFSCAITTSSSTILPREMIEVHA